MEEKVLFTHITLDKRGKVKHFELITPKKNNTHVTFVDGEVYINGRSCELKQKQEEYYKNITTNDKVIKRFREMVYKYNRNSDKLQFIEKKMQDKLESFLLQEIQRTKRETIAKRRRNEKYSIRKTYKRRT